MKRFFFVVGVLASLSVFADSDATILKRPTMPVRLVGPNGGEVGAVYGPDGGPVLTNPSAQVGSTHVELCAATNYDAGQYFDGGTGVYSTYAVPTGTRAMLVSNEGPNSCRLTIDGQTPVVTKLGIRIAGIASGESSVSDRVAIDCAPPACSTLKVLAKTADQATGACLQVSTLQ